MWRWRNKRAPDDDITRPPATHTARPALRRPLMGACFVFMAGLLVGLAWPVPPTWPLVAAYGSGLAALCLIRRRASLPLIWITLFCLACAHAALAVRNPAPRALNALMDRPREHVQVRGVIVDDPIEQVGPRDGTSVWRMTLELGEVNRIGVFQRAGGRVDVHWRNPPAAAPRPAFGDQWLISGVVQHREHSGWTWGWLPPYRMRVDSADARRLSEGHGSPLKRFAYAGRRAASEQLGRGLDAYPEVAGILRALLLGYRHELQTDQHRLFALTGTLHIFAISGLHVGIVATLLLVGVRAFGVSRTRWMFYVGPLLILYTVATGMRPSALRACAMALAFFAAFAVNRKPDAPSAWALAALLILGAAPTQLTSPGFIFSFVIVAGLIRLYPLLAGPAREWGMPDAYAPAASDQELSSTRKALLWFIGLAAASMAAWLSSAPLTAQYFNLFTPIGLIGNLFVIPAAFLVVLTGFLTLLVGLASDIGAEIFNHANRMILTTLISLIDALARVPGGHWHVRAPGPGWIALWYAFIFAGLAFITRRHRIAGYAALILLGCIAWSWQSLDHTTRVHVLNAGDGHAAYIRSGDAHVLFDAGPAYRADRVVRALRAEGVNRLDALILSHPSAGHAGGATHILEEFPVDEIWVTGFPSRSPAYDRALAFAAERDIPIVTRRAGDQGVWPGHTAWEILHPTDPTRYRRAADASLVIRVSRGAHAVLLMGGGGGAVESDTLLAARDPAADVLVIGNQGRDHVGNLHWLEAVSPGAVILAVDPYSRYGYPQEDVLTRLDQPDAFRLWRTDEAGRVEAALTSRIRFGRRADAWSVRGEWVVEE